MLSRRLFSVLLALAAVTLVTLAPVASRAAADGPLPLTLAYGEPEGRTILKSFIEPWADAVTRRTGGRIAFRLVSQSEAGAADLLDAVEGGTVDMAWTEIDDLAERLPAVEAFALPFIARSAAPTSRALMRFYRNEAHETLAGLTVLALHTSGAGVLHTRPPVMRLDFVKGKRLASPTRTVGWMLEDLGAAPVAMPAGSVVGALSAGTIDGAVIPWQAALATDLPLHLTNHTIFFADRGFGVTVHALVLNTAKLDGLPEDLRRAILADSDAAGAAGKAMDEGDRAGLDLAVGRGSNVITLEEKETQRWIDAARPVYERWVREVNAKGLDGGALLEKARALIEEESRR